MTTLAVSFTPHPVNGWWLRLLAVPYVAVDSDVTPCSWNRETVIDAPAGPHNVRTFVRYRRLVPGDLGTGIVDLHLPAGQTTRVQARNGPTNGSPFTPRVLP